MRQTWRPDRLGVRTETERVRCSSCGQRHVVIYGLKCYPGQERDDVGLDCQRCGAEDITRIYYVGAYA
ncbi:MAG: hypothetical protein KC468_32075, partial [Myxococcales bacterium]|nr:hypothetical protein [Myxococcales bacterium]